MTALPVHVDRSVFIRARRETVFTFFTDSDRFAAWWGAGSTIDARPGGAFVMCLPGGGEASGEVLEIVPPERIVLSYGFSHHPELPPGASRVRITLEAADGGTRVHLLHDLPDAALREQFEQGWRYHLAVFAHVVAERLHEDAERPVDAWFSAWSAAGPEGVAAALTPVVAPRVEFRDRFSVVTGLDDLVPHIAAAQRFMPGLRLVREGPVRQCHGTVLADWVALAQDGARKAEGTNVFTLDADNRIDRVTGFWSRHPHARDN
jgi:uncharacterized protein YndB with AHSA1/START domain